LCLGSPLALLMLLAVFPYAPSWESVRSVLVVVTVAVGNSVLANLVWRAVGVKHRRWRRVARAFAGLFCLANLVLAAFSLVQVWREGWNGLLIALLVLGLVFAFRFGGAMTGQYR